MIRDPSGRIAQPITRQQRDRRQQRVLKGAVTEIAQRHDQVRPGRYCPSHRPRVRSARRPPSTDSSYRRLPAHSTADWSPPARRRISASSAAGRASPSGCRREWRAAIAPAVNKALTISATSVFENPMSSMKGVNSFIAKASPILNSSTTASRASDPGSPSNSCKGVDHGLAQGTRQRCWTRPAREQTMWPVQNSA